LLQLRNEGVTDQRVLDALWRVPRERFVPRQLQHRAYENIALPIGSDQTISQPYVVARMAQALDLTEHDHVLEVGTGSGYGAAVLAQLAHDVVTVELRPELAGTAESRLRDLGYSNIRCVVGDGSKGWPALGPYDAIALTAATPSISPRHWEQLRENGGRLVAPIGTLQEQRLLLFRRSPGHLDCRSLGNVRFVPLLGVAGFNMLDPARMN
jgi:protein-L-isoaspartate(D-aspartate) O-methyltransferase